jgi:indolepyruvate ferredoxin oxidoreductase beta subunit
MPDIVIAGVGGQGTILASKLLAQAALLEGRTVRTAETIGMAQRGGSVLGHIRIKTPDAPPAASRLNPSHNEQHKGRSSSPVAPALLSPLVPLGQADLLIGFEPGETVRALDYLRPGGAVVTAMRALEPVTATLNAKLYDGAAEIAYLRSCKESGWLATLVLVDGEAACAQLGSTKVLNVVLLGAALASGGLDVPPAMLLQAIEVLLRPQHVALNKTALAKGMEGTG